MPYVTKSTKDMVSDCVSNAFHRLLSEKHLYQSHRISEIDINEIAGKVSAIREGSTTPEDFIEDCKQAFSAPWIPSSFSGNSPGLSTAASLGKAGAGNPVLFEVPSITQKCEICGKKQPFKVTTTSKTHYECFGFQDERFTFSFECQGCDTQKITFLISRENLQLQLCGRAPIEKVEVPTVIPKKFRHYFGNATVARNSGQILCAVFLLRVFVEQFWKSIDSIKSAFEVNSRINGQEMGEIYKEQLPTDFRDRFPTLKETYGKLSGAIHSASADDDLFEECRSEILKHFDARRLFEL